MNVTNTYQGEIHSQNAFPGMSTGVLNIHNYTANSQVPVQTMLEQQAPIKPFHTIPFRRNKGFVGREDISNWLIEQTEEHGSRAALVGLGGVGKSQIVIKHGYQIFEESDGTFVFWVYASSFNRFKEGYKTIANRLKIPGRDYPNADILTLVCEWLSIDENGPWLMIVDNADDASLFFQDQRSHLDPSQQEDPTLAEYLPTNGPGSIIITSRSALVAERLVTLDCMKEVPQMGKHSAHNLFCDRLGSALANDEPTNLELMEALDYMPLAIVQAAAFIKRRSPLVSVASYLEEFRQSDARKASLLKRPSAEPARDSKASNAIITTWQITFGKIRHEYPSATELLSLMSMFNPQAIPSNALMGKPWIKDRTRYNQEQLGDDLEVLRAYSLVQVMNENYMLEMHPLVSVCTRDWIEASSTNTIGDWEIRFLEQIRFTFIAVEDGKVGQELYHQLDPHIQTLIRTLPDLAYDQCTWYSLCLKVGRYYFSVGRDKDAERVLRRAIDTPGFLLLNHVLHIDIQTLQLMGAVFERRGNHQDASLHFQRAFFLLEKFWGRGHVETLNTAADLAMSQYREGIRNGKIEPTLRASLEGVKASRGEKDSKTLRLMSHLATVLLDKESYAEAEALHRAALEIKQEIYGKGSWATFDTQKDLAKVVLEQGRYLEAENLQRECVRGLRGLVSSDHPLLSEAKSQLALILERQGKFEEAEKMRRVALAAALKGWDSRLGRVENAYDRLITVLQAQGKEKEAGDLEKEKMEWITSDSFYGT